MAHRFGWIRARHRGCGCGSGPRVFFCYFRPGTLRGELAPQCPRPPLYRAPLLAQLTTQFCAS